MVDPVMVATSGAKLIDDQAIDTLKECLLPLATVLTPNIPEAEVLSGRKITSEEGMEEAAKVISETYHCAVLCKGGHQLNDANDLLYREGAKKWFTENGSIIQTPTEPGVPFPAPSLLIWPKGMSWIWRWREQKNIFPEL